MTLKGFITELDLNNKEKTKCLQHSGASRFAYNWAIDLINKTMPYGIYWTAIDLHKHWVATFKKENKWVREVSKWSPQQAFRNLELALKTFWDYKKETTGQKLPLEKIYKKKILTKVGKKYILKTEWKDKFIPINLHCKFPNFKKKSVKDKFYLEATAKTAPIIIDKNKIKLPKLGWVKTHEDLPEGMSPKNATILLQSSKWFVSFKYEVEPIKIKETKGKVGVDLGIKTLATLSDGKIFEGSKKYKDLQQKLARMQRKQSRQYEAHLKIEEDKKELSKKLKKGKIKVAVEKEVSLKKYLISNNYEKTKLLIQKIHYKIACIRKDILHKLTTYLAKNHSQVTIEDLNVSGMMKNHNLAKAIANGSFFEFRRQLTYKCEFYDTKLVIADRFFASSKTCSCCKHKQEMPLKKRIFDCEKCDLKIDRDLNAAINLENYAGSKSVKACGDSKFQDESSVGVNESGIKRLCLRVDLGKF